MAECANVLWKKVRRAELTPDEAMLAADLLQRAGIALYPIRPLLASAMRLAIDLDHPAYDCLYLVLALANDWQFVTADTRLAAKACRAMPAIAGMVLTLNEAAKIGEGL